VGSVEGFVACAASVASRITAPPPRVSPVPDASSLLAHVESRLEALVAADGAATHAIMAYLRRTRGKRLRPLLALLWHDILRPSDAWAAAGPADAAPAAADAAAAGPADATAADLAAPAPPAAAAAGAATAPTPAAAAACAAAPTPADAAVRSLVDQAAAVEMVHLASLLHDDLIDGAAERRGMPTVHARWDAAPAVLAGDYLFSSAFGLLVAGGHYLALGALARSLRDMSEAEIEQMVAAYELRSPADSLRAYWRCVRGKTGSLFGAACEVGAIAAGAGPDERDAARHFGLLLGSAFQVRDDLLDYTGDPERLGKPIGQDLSRGLLTLPAIRLLEAGGDAAAELVAAFAAREVSRDAVNRAMAGALAAGAAEECRTAIRDLMREARETLGGLPRVSRARAAELLSPVMGFATGRDH
jgi:geranylgeranyl pyrophosphate synthase